MSHSPRILCCSLCAAPLLNPIPVGWRHRMHLLCHYTLYITKSLMYKVGKYNDEAKAFDNDCTSLNLIHESCSEQYFTQSSVSFEINL